MEGETYNDGNIPHGSAVLTCQETNVTYDCDDFNEPVSKTMVVKRKKASGKKGGSFGTDDFLEGSTTVQLATNETASLVGGQTFKTDVTGDKIWIITDAGKAHPKENYKTQSISFIEKLN